MALIRKDITISNNSTILLSDAIEQGLMWIESLQNKDLDSNSFYAELFDTRDNSIVRLFTNKTRQEFNLDTNTVYVITPDILGGGNISNAALTEILKNYVQPSDIEQLMSAELETSITNKFNERLSNYPLNPLSKTEFVEVLSGLVTKEQLEMVLQSYYKRSEIDEFITLLTHRENDNRLKITNLQGKYSALKTRVDIISNSISLGDGSILPTNMTVQDLESLIFGMVSDSGFINKLAILETQVLHIIKQLSDIPKTTNLTPDIIAKINNSISEDNIHAILSTYSPSVIELGDYVKKSDISTVQQLTLDLSLRVNVLQTLYNDVMSNIGNQYVKTDEYTQFVNAILSDVESIKTSLLNNDTFATISDLNNVTKNLTNINNELASVKNNISDLPSMEYVNNELIQLQNTIKSFPIEDYDIIKSKVLDLIVAVDNLNDIYQFKSNDTLSHFQQLDTDVLLLNNRNNVIENSLLVISNLIDNILFDISNTSNRLTNYILSNDVEILNIKQKMLEINTIKHTVDSMLDYASHDDLIPIQNEITQLYNIVNNIPDITMLIGSVTNELNNYKNIVDAKLNSFITYSQLTDTIRDIATKDEIVDIYQRVDSITPSSIIETALFKSNVESLIASAIQNNPTVDESQIQLLLSDYMLESSVSNLLNDYVTSTTLSNLLTNMLTSQELSQALGDYVTHEDVVALTSNFVKYSDIQYINNNITTIINRIVSAEDAIFNIQQERLLLIQEIEALKVEIQELINNQGEFERICQVKSRIEQLVKQVEDINIQITLINLKNDEQDIKIEQIISIINNLQSSVTYLDQYFQTFISTYNNLDVTDIISRLTLSESKITTLLIDANRFANALDLIGYRLTTVETSLGNAIYSIDGLNSAFISHREYVDTTFVRRDSVEDAYIWGSSAEYTSTIYSALLKGFNEHKHI